MKPEYILEKLPYDHPFLFVDELLTINHSSVEGTYNFPEDSFFYKGHFKDFPVTPGVILTECMAQIGVVCLGIFLIGNEIDSAEKTKAEIALSSTEMEFYLPVLPKEKVRVVSEKIYFRFNKLKCKVKMFNENNKLVSKGIISGMIKANL